MHFGSVARIAAATKEEVAELVGEKLATEILKSLRGDSSPSSEN